MFKDWKILPKISQNFIKTWPHYNILLLQLLFNRGFTEETARQEFLRPDFTADIYSPDSLLEIAAATKLIINHIKQKNKIVIYGDYDADGVAAAVLLFEVIQTLRANVDVYIPDRVSEGYGLNKLALTAIADDGAKLLITVDSAIRNKEEVEFAHNLDLEVIVTDHHTPPEVEQELPDCLIINPKLKKENYPFKNLAGVGVALKLAQKLISASKLAESDKQKLIERALDLVAIGTIADCVSLLGENRALVTRGLEVVNKKKRLGLKELIQVAGLNRGKNIDAWNIGFQIAPRLNAAGRMGHANTSFELLVTRDKKEAEVLAKRLNDSNIDRQRNTDDILAQVQKQLEKRHNDKILIGVYQLDENLEQAVWNEGVIGLVAGKICEKYYKPTLVITSTNDGYKGSGRSIPEFNIISALNECAAWLDKYGGHPLACGFSLNVDKLNGFTERIKTIAARELNNVNLTPKIIIEAEINLADINESLLKMLRQLEPYGEGNARPKFLSRNCLIADKINMGIESQHVKFRLKGKAGNFISALGFSQAERWQDFKIGDKIDIVYYIEVNEFNGRSEIQLKIIDIKLAHNT